MVHSAAFEGNGRLSVVMMADVAVVTGTMGIEGPPVPIVSVLEAAT